MSRRASTRRIVACAAALAAAAIAATSCAAILGIDDVSLKDGGADTGTSQDASFLDASFLDASSVDATSSDAGSNYASVVLGDSPIAYWKLDDVGPIAIDSSPHHLDATYGQGVAHARLPISGQTGLSTTFPGSPDGGDFGPGVTLARNAAFEVQGPLTVEAWIHPVLPNQSEIVTYGAEVGPTFQPWGLQYAPGTQFYSSCCGNVNGTNPLDVGSTYYLVATFDDLSGTVLYVNGKIDGDGGIGGVLTGYDGITGLGIGSGPNGELPFKGAIAEVAVYDKVLSPVQILAHYNAGR